MRKVAAAAVGLSLLVGLPNISGAEAAKRKKKPPRQRTVETPYSEPAVGTAGIGVCFPGSSCVFVEPAKGEQYVSVEIEDELGLPVYASVIQDTSGDGNYLATDDRTVHICGATDEPLEIEPTTVTVWVWRGPGLVPGHVPGLRHPASSRRRSRPRSRPRGARFTAVRALYGLATHGGLREFFLHRHGPAPILIRCPRAAASCRSRPRSSLSPWVSLVPPSAPSALLWSGA